MSFDAGSITGSLGIDTDPFAKGMLKATSIAQLFPATVTNFLANPLLGVVGVMKSASQSIIGGLQLIHQNFLDVGHAADNMGEAAQKAGVSAAFLSTVGRAAGDAGGSVESLGDALKFLNKNTAEALSGNKEVTADFERLGVSVRDTAGNQKTSEALFFEVADAIKALPSAAQQTSAAMSLLGRGGNDLIPLLTQGSAAIKEQAALFKELGATMDAELVRAGDKLGTFTTIWDAAWQGIRNEAARPLLLAFEANFEDAVEGVKVGSSIIRSLIGATWQGLRAELGGPMPVSLLDQMRLAQSWVEQHLPEIRDAVARFTERTIRAMEELASGAKFVIDHGEQIARVLGVAILGKSLLGTIGIITQMTMAVRGLGVAYAQAGASARTSGLLGGGKLGGAVTAGIGAAGVVGLGGGGTGAQVGAGVGTAIGSAFGPVGTAIGAVAGTGIGITADQVKDETNYWKEIPKVTSEASKGFTDAFGTIKAEGGGLIRSSANEGLRALIGELSQLGPEGAASANEAGDALNKLEAQSQNSLRAFEIMRKGLADKDVKRIGGAVVSDLTSIERQRIADQLNKLIEQAASFRNGADAVRAQVNALRRAVVTPAMELPASPNVSNALGLELGLDDEKLKEKRRIADSVAQYEAQAKEAALRAAGKIYEADTAKFEFEWQKRIVATRTAEERMAAIHARDAERTKRTIEHESDLRKRADDDRKRDAAKLTRERASLVQQLGESARAALQEAGQAYEAETARFEAEWQKRIAATAEGQERIAAIKARAVERDQRRIEHESELRRKALDLPPGKERERSGLAQQQRELSRFGQNQKSQDLIDTISMGKGGNLDRNARGDLLRSLKGQSTEAGDLPDQIRRQLLALNGARPGSERQERAGAKLNELASGLRASMTRVDDGIGADVKGDARLVSTRNRVREIGEELKKLQQLAGTSSVDVASLAARAVGGNAPSPTAGANAGGPTVESVNVNMQKIDTSELGDYIATKLNPMVRTILKTELRNLDAALKGDSVEAGL